MDVGRFAGTEGAEDEATHARIAEYVRPVCERYPGMGFTPREEWVVEQTVRALVRFLNDVRCAEEERAAVMEFLRLAAEQLPGRP